MATKIADVVKKLGKSLPAVKIPQFSYVSAVRTGNLLFISGQISERGEAVIGGTLGNGVTVEAGKDAAERCALAVVAQIAANSDGNVESVRRIVRLGVFVASAPDFNQQSQVANGASDVMVAVFGDAGKHARAAVGVAALPAGAAVEVDAIVELVS